MLKSTVDGIVVVEKQYEDGGEVSNASCFSAKDITKLPRKIESVRYEPQFAALLVCLLSC